ncbi:MAG: hypothetical protein GY827_12585 [Cytophagales bacterium]|nr:hypothetical protein [Cytophagales bacterium]
MMPEESLDSNFIKFTEEANGDYYCYHKESGNVWKHHHEGYEEIIEEEYGIDVKLLNSDNDNQLFEVENCNFVTWVERTASSWLECLKSLPYEDD